MFWNSTTHCSVKTDIKCIEWNKISCHKISNILVFQTRYTALWTLTDYCCVFCFFNETLPAKIRNKLQCLR